MFSLDPNTPSFLLEGETLTLSFSADAPQNDAFAIKWLIIPRGVLPVTFGPDGDFASHMGVYEVSAPAGASSFSFDIASLDNQRGGPDKDFVIELYEDKGADDDVFIGSAALRLNNDDEVAPRRVNVVGDGVGNSNVLVLGSNQDETLNGGTGDDLYVVTPHQYGNAIIQSGSGHNTIRLDYGVEIVDMSELVFDQTFNGQIPLETVREALGLPELTLEQAQNYPREVTLSLSTGGTIEIDRPALAELTWQLGSDAPGNYLHLSEQFKVDGNPPSAANPLVIETLGEVPDLSGNPQQVTRILNTARDGAAGVGVLDDIIMLSGEANLIATGGLGNDYLVISRYLTGTATISDANGITTVRLDYGVEIVAIDPLIFDQTFNGQIPLETVREALGLPELTLEQAQNYPREVTLTLSTGATVRVMDPALPRTLWQLGDGEAQNYFFIENQLIGTVPLPDRSNLAPVFNQESYQFGVDENTAAVIGTVDALDPEGEAVSYSLAMGSGVFAIDADTGSLSFANGAPDYETLRTLGEHASEEAGVLTFNLMVVASDGVNVPQQSVTVSLRNVNEASTYSGTRSTSINADDTSIVSGSLAIADPDEQGGDIVVSTSGSSNNYGTPAAINVGGSNVVWTYNLDETHADIVALDDGETLPATLTPSTPVAVTINENDVIATGTEVVRFTAVPPIGGTVTSLRVLMDGMVSNDYAIVATANENEYVVESTTAGLTYDHETVGSVTLTIEVTASNDLSSSFDFTYTIDDVAEAVSYQNLLDGMVSLAVETPENQLTIGTYLPDHRDEGDDITYSLSGSNSVLFSIDENAGTLSWVDAPDHETGPGPYSVIITATETPVTGGPDNTADLVLTVTVSDVNEAPTFVTPAPISTPYSTVGALTAELDIEDQDTGDTSGVTVTLSGAANYGSVTISESAGVYSYSYDLNEGSAAVMALVNGNDLADSFRITATDTEGASTEVTVNVTIEGVIPTLTVTPTTAVSGSVNENQAISTVDHIVDFTATPSVNQTVTFRVLEGGVASGNYSVTSDGGDAYYVTAANGNVMYDFEETESVVLTIEVSSSDGLTETFDFTYTIVDVAEPVSFDDLLDGAASLAVSTPENQLAIDTYTPSHVDPGDTITYSLTGVDAAMFSINATSGALSWAANPDHETGEGPFNVTVRATESPTGGGADNIAELALVVTLTDVNEAPNFTPPADFTVVYDTTDVASAVLDVTDPEDSALTYSVSGAASYGTVTITEAGGVYSYEYDLDETNAAIMALADGTNLTDSFRLTATDPEGLDTEVEVTVTIDGQLPSRIAPTSAISATVVEETALPSDGSIVTFAATAREGRTFTNWRVLEGGLDTGNFEVVDVAGGEQGVSATAGDYAFDFETVGSTVTLTIEGTDSADDVVSFTFTYTVTNVDEPVNFNNLLGDMSSLSVETPENQLIIGSYVPINIDTGDTVAYSLTGVDQGLFSINSLTGELSWVNAPNHEASSGPFNVTIVATETPNGGGTNVANLPLVITVTNVNEAPLISTPDPLTVVFDSTATQVREIPVTDPDTGNATGVSVAVTGAASYGDVTISQSGGVYSYHYNLDEDDPDVTALINGNDLIDTFTVTAADGEGASTELDIDVTIDGISPQLIFPQGGGLSASLLENTDAPTNHLNPFAVFEMVFVEGDDWDTLERLELDGVTPNYDYGLTASSQPENHRGIYMQRSRIRFDYEEQTEDHLLIRLTTDFGIVEDVVFTLNIINVQESVSWSNILQGEPSLAISTPENQLAIDTFYPVNIEEDFGDTVSFSLRGSHAYLFNVSQDGLLSWADNPELAMGAGPFYVVIRATETYDGTRTRYSDLNLYVTLVAEDTGGAPMLMPEPFMADPYAEPDELLTAPPEPDPEVINIRPPEEPVAIEPYDEPEGIPVAPVEPVPIEPYDDDQQDYAVITPDIL